MCWKKCWTMFEGKFSIFYTVKKMLKHNLPKETTFFGKFSIFYTVKKTSKHNLPKNHFKDANVVLTTFPAMTDSTEETDEQRFARGASTGWPPAERPPLFRVGKLWIFWLNCWIIRFWQIVSRQIVVGKLSVGKTHFDTLPFGKSLPTQF